MATIVFTRTSIAAEGIVPLVFSDGHYLGDLRARAKLVAHVPPGRHKFVAGPSFSPADCRQLRAEVEAGKLYVVETELVDGAVSFHVRGKGALAAALDVPSREPEAPAAPSLSPSVKCAVMAENDWARRSQRGKAYASLHARDGLASLP